MGKLFKRGKNWGVTYMDPNGQQVRKMVSPYKESAERILKKIETDIIEGKYLDITNKQKVLFEDFAWEYIKTHVRLHLKGKRNQEYIIKRLITEFQGKHLDKITPIMIRKYIAQKLETGVRPSTVNRWLQTIKSMFSRAIEWGMLHGRNPATGLKNIPQNNSRCRWLTEEEQSILLGCCNEHLTRIVVLIALKTGMRWGEIISLKWQQSPCSNYVDFDKNVIFIHESMTKTQRSRHIPLIGVVREAIGTIERIPGTDNIFLNPKTEKPFGSFKRSFHTALRRAGISDFRFHDLRHTFASSLVRSNVDLYTVQRLLGHTTPQMTQRYAHLGEDQMREAIEKIDTQPTNLLYNSVSHRAIPEKIARF